MWPENVDDMTSTPGSRIGEHEVFFSFNSDSDAMDFRDWLQDAGWKHFEAYKNGVIYEP